MNHAAFDPQGWDESLRDQCRQIIELVPHVELTAIPHAPSFLTGLLGYRGHVIPVIDLGLLLNSVPCRHCLSTRIILVNEAHGDHNSVTNNAEDSTGGDMALRNDRTREPRLLGLIGEKVSDLTCRYSRIRWRQLPVQLPQMAFLDGIVQTAEGIIQLIAVERIRERALAGYILDQGASITLVPEREVGDPSMGGKGDRQFENSGSELRWSVSFERSKTC